MFSKIVTISALAASASAHILMHYPVPFGKDTLNTSPLGRTDFPCKQRQGVYAVDTMNTWNAGQTQNVSFMGTAVHGGGSCQFSITTDAEPNENSQWKVIQSVIGGCPTARTNENFPEVAGIAPTDSPVPDEFPVTMPSDIPAGRYTFAWTWNNKVGNREFYMNCAPIQVGGGSGKASTASASKALAALPDMFVSNLPADKCTTDPSTNFVYPDPGQNARQLKQDSLSTKVTGTGCSAMNKLGAGSGQIGSPSAGTPSTPSQGTPSQQSPVASGYPVASPPSKGPSESKAPVNPGGVFAPGASSAPASTPTAQPAPIQSAAPPSAAPPAAAPPAAKPEPSAAPQTPNTTTPSNGECTPCTNDGAVVCIGSNQFGLCNRGCAVAQDLAAGMSCSAGVVVASTKRNINFPRAHIHRRHSAAHLI
jgi:hypothetical protein